MSATSSSTHPVSSQPPTPGQQQPALPLLATSTSSRRSTQPRPMSHASRSRLSQYSTGSNAARDRPSSHVFPLYPSSLSYSAVRDFAYSVAHPLHYGPPPESSAPSSGVTTPSSERRRLSENPASWEQKMPWDSWTADGFNRGHDIPPIQFGDGPPYSEDEDLQSPVVATRHRKHKSTSAALHASRARVREPGLVNTGGERGFFVGTGTDGSERYYVNHGSEANGPGGELVTYPPDQARRSQSHYYGQPLRTRVGNEGQTATSDDSDSDSPDFHEDQSRYSRDYQFTITSPDEEFHGKAVALFDFERENENELPLVEGQIIWVSYRHGQGWLVAEDPKTEESGLVPEEYVRLLRDIEGGMNSLTGNLAEGSGSPNDIDTPTQPEASGMPGQSPNPNNPLNGYPQPVVSMFSTSSKDLNPYPTGQLGLQAGQTPPQVVHYQGQRGGSQANTPTIGQHSEGGFLRRESFDADAEQKIEAENAIGGDKSKARRDITQKVDVEMDTEQ